MMDSSALVEVLACTSVVSFHLAAGTVMAFSAVVIPQLEAQDSDIQVTKNDISWLASVIMLTMPFGSLVTGYLVDKIGRLNTIRLAMVPYMLGWLCIAMATNLSYLMLGRLLTGFSLALASNPAIVYITEVARPELRGALICLAPSLSSFGMVVVYAQGALMSWRMIAWLSITYCLLPILSMSFWAPESAVWFVSKGKTDRALDSLRYLLRKDKNVGLAEQRLEVLVQEHNKLKASLRKSGSSFGNFFRDIIKPTALKPILILTVVFLLQQFSGIYITIFYTVTFFKEVGASIDEYVSTIGIGLVRMIMSIITVFLLKTFNRRPLFIISSVGMALFIFTSGYFTKEIAEGKMEKNVVPVVCVLLYMSMGVIGFMSIPWTMTAELFATEIRGMAQGLMIAIADFIMFATLKVYPFMAESIGGSYAVQWFFGSVSLVGVVFIFIFLPETHNKTLSEIQDYFAKNTLFIMRRRSSPTKEVVHDNGVEETVKLKEVA